MNQKPHNKCLIDLVCSVCTGKYLPSFFFAQTSLLRRSVCTKTSGKYFPLQTSHSVNKPLVLNNVFDINNKRSVLCKQC